MRVHQRVYGVPYWETQVNSLGNNAWEIVVRSEEGEDMFTLQGSNGTFLPADDLWGQLDTLIQAI